MSSTKEDLLFLQHAIFGNQIQSDDQNMALIKYTYESIPDKYKNPLNLSTLKQAILDETQAEFTFRVEFPYPSRFGQFCMLSIPKVGEAPEAYAW